MANDEDTEASPFTRPRFLLAAAFMIALVAMLVWLLVRGGSEESDADEEASSSEPATETSSDAPSAEPEAPSEPASSDPASVQTSWCGLEAVDTEGTLTRAPADTEWQYVGTAAVPAVEGHGPGVVEDSGFRHCFAQTPTGAVMAAMNYLIAANTTELQAEVAEHLIVDGDLRDVALATSPGSAEEASGSGTRLAIEGFRLLAYSEENADVDVLVSSGAADGYVSFVLPFAWRGGEWLLDIQTEQEMGTTYAEVRSPSGYVIWRAE